MHPTSQGSCSSKAHMSHAPLSMEVFLSSRRHQGSQHMHMLQACLSLPPSQAASEAQEALPLLQGQVQRQDLEKSLCLEGRPRARATGQIP